MGALVGQISMWKLMLVGLGLSWSNLYNILNIPSYPEHPELTEPGSSGCHPSLQCCWGTSSPEGARG